MSAELRAPLTVVDALFEKCQTSDGNLPPAKWGEREHFIQALGLTDEENFAKIPCLNDVDLVESVPPFSLVRYRAMVQDVFEPELYETVFTEVATDAAQAAPCIPKFVTTKYRECIEPSPGKELEAVGANSFGVRGACYCVPIPGEAPWAKAAAKAWVSERGGAVFASKSPVQPNPSSAPKRSRPDEDVDMSGEAGYGAHLQQQAQQPHASRNSRPRNTICKAYTAGQPRGLCSAEDFGLNFPLAWEEQRGRGDSTACLVKLYDDDAESLRVCETIEVVGVLCVNPELASFDNTPLAESDWFRDARQPSTSMVPRLHAIFVRRLPFYHPVLPYSVDWLSEARLAAAYSNSFSSPGALDTIWRSALAQITAKLAGDKLAAQYLLLQGVSRAFGKVGEQSLGSWTLSLTKWPSQGVCVDGLKEVMQELFPRVIHLSITADTLETRKWRPRKDEIANRLVAGQLQISPGSVLLLDEVHLSEGQLSVNGVKNLTAIGMLVSEGILNCDFEFSEVKLPLEISPVVLSAQTRPLTTGKGIPVPICPDGNTEAEAASAASSISSSLLDAVRLLVALVTRSPKPLSIPADVANRFGEDFARIRQKFEVSQDLCNTWMCLARAWCLWHGENELSINRWQEVFELEQQRLSRCQC